MPKINRFALPAVVLTLAVTGMATAGVVGLPAWDVVRSRSAAGVPNELLGVAAVTPEDVWAVGFRGDRTLTERWDGSAFSIVPSPSPRDRSSVLEDVSGTGPDDVWAVGHADDPESAGSRTLIIHWDGSDWGRMPAPNRGDADAQNLLTGVVAVARDDAWAVGSFGTIDPSSARALTLHWDGSTWTAVPNGCGRGLRDVFALSSTNVWAVGGTSTCRWNGTAWTRRPAAPSTNPSHFVDLQDVTGTGPDNLWAVGVVFSSCGEGQVCHSGVIEHWNGTAWSFRSAGAILYGVHAVSANDIYAVGTGLGPAILHHDGSGWDTVPAPTPPVAGRLFAVDGSSADDLWAAGWRLTEGSRKTLVEKAPSETSGAVVGPTGVSRATVSWFGPESGSVESDQFGRYQVGGLTAGRYTMRATNPGCTPASKEVTVVAGTTTSVALRPTC